MTCENPGTERISRDGLAMGTVRLHVGERARRSDMSGSSSDITTRVFHFSVIVYLKRIPHKIRPLVYTCLASESQEFPSMVITLRSRCEDGFTSSPGAALIPSPPGDFPDPR